MNSLSFLTSIKLAYPDFVKDVAENALYLFDGSVIDVNLNQIELNELSNINNLSDIDRLISDVSRIRLHKLLKTMYGENEQKVKSNLVEISWLPKTINKKILITRINGANEKLQLISNELDLLPKKFKKYVEKLSGTFNWRNIADSKELSPHSYGIAIDINKKYANYWKWDLKKGESSRYKNQIPYEIVRIFERHGFIWGGRWKSYDTMHFEYRPEFLMNRKKRILLISRGGLKYGSEMQLLRLTENINQEKFEQHLITTDKNTDNYPVFAQHSFRLPAWGKIKNLFSRYWSAKKLLDYAKHNNIDLIHCSYQWLYPYAHYIARKLNIPVILNVRRPNNKHNLIKNYSYADGIICISKRVKQEFLNCGVNSDCLFLIYDAIQTEFKINTSKDEFKKRYLLKGKFIIAIVGRIHRNKKQDLFIALANLISQAHDCVDFLIVGKIDDAEFYNELKMFASASNSNIVFIGHVDDMQSIYNAIDILITFSGGSVMYEAMAMGKTVISIGFVNLKTSEFLIQRQTAFIIEDFCLETARDNVLEVLNDSELSQQIGQRASTIIRQKLDSKLLTLQVEDVYRNYL